MYWNMDEKGADRPSRSISKSKRERGGKSVLPGTYKLVLTDGNLEKTQQITVAADPRLGESIAAMKEVYDTETLLEGYMQTAADAVKQLVESKQIADQFSKELSDLDKKGHKESIQKAKDISKEIDSLLASYLGTIDKRQGITRNPEITVMQRIGNASSYVGSRKTGMTATEDRLMRFAKNELKKALKNKMTFLKTNGQTLSLK
jgi:hypothetical protein